MEDAIVFRDVDFTFDHFSVLEKVNLKIKKGDFIGIVGPNGGGKTTFLKLVCGILAPTKGKVLVFGKKPEAFYPKISYVPQVSRIERDFPISLLELVLLGCNTLSNCFFNKKSSKSLHMQKALYLLKKLGLLKYKHQSIGTLSGGQAQKALIAKALISEPEILVLDEPTANIDAKGEEIIFELIKKDFKGKTILMVSHDLNIVIRDVKKLFFIDKKVASKLPKEVCEHFALGLYHSPLLKQKPKKLKTGSGRKK